MKKILFILTALTTLPLTAKAEVQLAPEKMPEATIQAAVKDFADPWCKTGFKGLVKNVKKCFKEIPENNPNIDKCVVGHYALFNQTGDAQALAKRIGEEDPTTYISFIKPQVRHDRGVHYINLPRYQKVNTLNYFSPGIDKVIEKIEDNKSKCSSN